jgi:hypothetical protein
VVLLGEDHASDSAEIRITAQSSRGSCQVIANVQRQMSGDDCTSGATRIAVVAAHG